MRCAIGAVLLFLCAFAPLAPHGASAEFVFQEGFQEEGGHHGSQHEVYAPIGVMGDHVHHAGGGMFSYRYARMRMDGNRDGTNRVQEDKIVLPAGSYMATPTDMDMEMHLFGGMYAPTHWVTLVAMLPYVHLEMDHINAAGVRFRTKSDGPGDLRTAGLFPIWRHEGHQVHLNVGMSWPIGSINHRDNVPTPGGVARVRLPYPMQISSGTFDFLPGATYQGQSERWSWGFQALGTVRLDENDNDYTLGNRVDLTAWGTREITDWLSASLRFAYANTSNIDGADPKLNPAAIPTADPRLRGGQRLDLLAGLSFQVPLGPLGSHRLAIEGGGPIFQKLDGPQLETDWRIVVGWQKVF